ncbi:hypothetical protein B0H15DRAFT_934634 [Mycena belliarum]|uniref:Uncharacterized protein n=1 Tax=Mycena belliarum TaxID=1033014 RepID=A0AAD6XJG1_9AGAR|nr:hypothetical protein B0H15DRAFT_934634 [Mycena belliae]
MPAPVAVGIYVLAAIGSVAAGLAFKEFVYEPHIAPRVERWAEEFLANRRARKMQRAGFAAVPVPSHSGKHSDYGHGDGREDTEADARSTYELESLVANEVRSWRAQVDAGRGEGSGLRHRKNGSMTALDESNIIIPYSPMTPTHVLFDPAEAMSLAASSPVSTSTMSSRVPTPSPHSTLSHSFRMPPPPGTMQAPPTPEPSTHGSPAHTPLPIPANTSVLAPPAPPTAFLSAVLPEPQDPFLSSSEMHSPHHVPSLSLSHPLDLAADAERDLELLSAPASSRPVSPFSELSAFSQSHDDTDAFQSFTLSPGPELTVLSASEAGSEAGDDRWSNADSEISGSSWASAGRF